MVCLVFTVECNSVLTLQKRHDTDSHKGKNHHSELVRPDILLNHSFVAPHYSCTPVKIIVMLSIQSFTFNPFQENTYVLFDETGESIIIDPGMSDVHEQQQFMEFIRSENLKPVKLLNTHCHIDHILGNDFVAKKFSLPLEAHSIETVNLNRAEQAAMLFGVNYIASPPIGKFIGEGDTIKFGNSKLEIVFVPGHSPGHLAFISHDEKVVIGGDVLFLNSVGRVDLPGCNANDLLKSIREKFYTLPDDYIVYPGHGPETTIGYEKENNYFVKTASQQLI